MAAKRKGGNGRKKTILHPIPKKDARRGPIVFSPACKAFSFGHSSVDVVVNRFMAGNSAELQGATADSGLQTLHWQHGEICTELAYRWKQKKRADEVLAKVRAGGDQTAAGLDHDMHDMGYEDMAALVAALMQVKAAVSVRANQVLVEAYHIDICSKLLVPPPPPMSVQLFGGTTCEFDASNARLHPQEWTCTRCLWRCLLLPVWLPWWRSNWG
ncbi:uncharacterized protein [Aegilops tauschii subsp. strangulata]|uniref:uncharacterized protein n=1 Tax=Aegilops tauschii subsp. strangulata TaxID=200361 RepID=UPI00098B0F9D|nr:uncharacterized protein LOC109771294 [Aegilops tauschii subsp. strangulata]